MDYLDIYYLKGGDVGACDLTNRIASSYTPKKSEAPEMAASLFVFPKKLPTRSIRDESSFYRPDQHAEYGTAANHAEKPEGYARWPSDQDLKI